LTFGSEFGKKVRLLPGVEKEDYFFNDVFNLYPFVPLCLASFVPSKRKCCIFGDTAEKGRGD